jgi:hypothetical protein
MGWMQISWIALRFEGIKTSGNYLLHYHGKTAAYAMGILMFGTILRNVSRSCLKKPSIKDEILMLRCVAIKTSHATVGSKEE